LVGGLTLMMWAHHDGEADRLGFLGQGTDLLHQLVLVHRSGNDSYAQRTIGGPETTPIINQGKANWCFGINAMNLGLVLRVGSEKIFDHNRARMLFLVGTKYVAPTHGATAAKRYVFQIGDVQADITIETGGPSGNA
jgi:hypothetical protein